MLKLAMIFQDRMVLQRNQAIPIWGTAEPGQVVSVLFRGISSTARADEKGNWRLDLEECDTAYDLELKVSADGETILLRDICVGEVWLAGGQSNMEYLLGFEQHFEQVRASEQVPWIRFFDYPEVSYEGELEDFHYTHEGFWRKCTRDDLPYFSAVGYYFADDLQNALQIPVGIIGCNWAGTPACAWMEAERLRGTEGQVWVDEYEEAVRDLDIEKYQEDFKRNPVNDRTNQYEAEFNVQLLKIGVSREEQLKLLSSFEDAAIELSVPGPYSEHRPGGLYETMLKKIAPYGIRGIIWYQGETDGDNHPEIYETVFSLLIENWRELWQQELPFLFVQLAPFRAWMQCVGSEYHFIREAQARISESVPRTWMASIGDSGMMWDIHPKNKKTVGHRLALLARGHVYGEALLCDAPKIRHVSKTGNRLILEFDHADGLYISGDRLNDMTILDHEGRPIDFGPVEVRNQQLIVCGCEDASRIEFTAGDYYNTNLYNQSDIPALPFVYDLKR